MAKTYREFSESYYKPGHDLKVGDILEVWWRPGRDTITEIEPYKGPLESIFSEGASIAYFAIWHLGMTIPHTEAFKVIGIQGTS